MRAIILVATSLLLAAGVSACSKNNSTTTSPSTSPTSFTFASQLSARGATSRIFSMTTGGTITATLATLGNGSLKAGMGIGVVATGAPCSLTQSVVTGPGSSPQVSVTADPGTYCVQVYDTGTLTEDTAFSIVVTHP